MKIVGDAKPMRAVYWAIRLNNPATGEPVATRWSYKTDDPELAARSVFCIAGRPSDNFTAYNLGGRLDEARRKVRELQL